MGRGGSVERNSSDSDTTSPGVAVRGPEPLGGFRGRGHVPDPGTQGFSGWRRRWDPWPGSSQKEAMAAARGRQGPWPRCQRSAFRVCTTPRNVEVPRLQEGTKPEAAAWGLARVDEQPPCALEH